MDLVSLVDSVHIKTLWMAGLVLMWGPPVQVWQAWQILETPASSTLFSTLSGTYWLLIGWYIEVPIYVNTGFWLVDIFRFTPGFCHSLHHLHQDLTGQDLKIEKDSDQECLLDVIQTLHHLFQKLCNTDCEPGGSDPRDPVLPSALLHSIGRLCPLFEGNQQQDAHELLVTLLTSLQDVKIPDPLSRISSPDKPDSSDASEGRRRNNIHLSTCLY